MGQIQSFYDAVRERFPKLLGGHTDEERGTRIGLVIDQGDTEATAREAGQSRLIVRPDTNPGNETHGAAGVADRDWGGNGTPGRCDIVLDGTRGIAPNAHWMEVTQHEMTHCAMVDLVGHDRYMGLMGRIADQVPLDDLERWWAPRGAANGPSDSHADRTPSVAQEDAAFGRSECYAERGALDVWSFVREDPATGRLHLDSAHLAGPYGGRLATYIEEAATALGAERTFAREPLAPPKGHPTGRRA